MHQAHHTDYERWRQIAADKGYIGPQDYPERPHFKCFVRPGHTLDHESKIAAIWDERTGIGHIFG